MAGTAKRLAPPLALAAALACAAPPPPLPPEPRLALEPPPAPAETPEPPAVAPSGIAPPPAAHDPGAAERAQLEALAGTLRAAGGESDPARAAERTRAGLAEALPHLERQRGPDDPLVRDLADTLRDLEALRAERDEMEERLARRQRAADLTHAGLDLAADGDADAAIDTLERAIVLHEAEAGSGPEAARALGASLSYLGRLRADRGDPEAAALLERSLALLEPALGRLDPLTLATRARLERLRAGAPPAARPD